MHLAADGRCRPLSLVITPGKRADGTQLEATLEKIRVPGTGLGRPRRTRDSVGADKAYSNRAIRSYLPWRGIWHVIPEQKDQQAGRPRRARRVDGPLALTPRGTRSATRSSGRSTS
ncbi:transposase [Streptomyces longisporus]|uniref:transposase n=1 Tax=Streptomyces longisporus TaxID=1948 RepID=UPI003CD06A31